jgi:hypothetical protein
MVFAAAVERVALIVRVLIAVADMMSILISREKKRKEK